jgi:ribose/xylose/arabinose/galactoside ABC-type transport system permease subunit
VILTGGIDLSVGSILALSTSVVAMVLTRALPNAGYGLHIVASIFTAAGICAAVGA